MMTFNDKIELRVLGITRNQVQSNAYALLLEQVGGPYRIPIVVGTPEAQSIAMRMENIITPRPLTHDLFTSIFHAFGVVLDYVYIHDFNDGVFSAVMHLSSSDAETDLDVRTSDAVAIAIRTGAPIFTTERVMLATGYVSRQDDGRDEGDTMSLEDMSVERLQQAIARCVEREDYEQAAHIQKIIARKLAGCQTATKTDSSTATD